MAMIADAVARPLQCAQAGRQRLGAEPVDSMHLHAQFGGRAHGRSLSRWAASRSMKVLGPLGRTKSKRRGSTSATAPAAGQVADLARGRENPGTRESAHAGTFVQDPIHRGGRHPGGTRDVDHGLSHPASSAKHDVF